MATIASLILDVEEMVYGQALVERPAEDTVITAPSPAVSGTTVDMTTDALWKKDHYAERVPADGTSSEVIIFAADAAGSTAIRRAQRGTTAATWVAGDVVRKNPPFLRSTIERFINEAINDHLYPHVWYHTERTIGSFDDLDSTYDVDAADFDVLQIYQYDLGGDQNIAALPIGWWEVIPHVSTTVASTGKALRVRRVLDGTETVFYTAKTKPLAANIASFPDDISSLIPWKVCGMLLGGVRTSVMRYDPNRQALPDPNEGGPTRDWRFFEQMFLLKRGDLQRKLRYEERGLMQPRFRPRTRRRWIGV